MNKIPIIVFYPVDNKMGYDRHSFDCMSDFEVFAELYKSDERDWYVAHTNSFRCHYPNLAEFADNYNNEDYDGGWWCWTGFLLPEDLKEIVGY